LSFAVVLSLLLAHLRNAAMSNLKSKRLCEHRTLDTEQIDDIISHAPECAQRVDWIGGVENAADFTAGLGKLVRLVLSRTSGTEPKADMAQSGGKVSV
jgi:hypothetical protein